MGMFVIVIPPEEGGNEKQKVFVILIRYGSNTAKIRSMFTSISSSSKDKNTANFIPCVRNGHVFLLAQLAQHGRHLQCDFPPFSNRYANPFA